MHRLLFLPVFFLMSLPALGKEPPAVLAKVNSYVNAVMVYTNDAPGTDTWTLGAIMGDCDDFALNKVHLLRKKGIDAEIGVFRRPEKGAWHAVAFVDGWVLDNLEPFPYRKSRASFYWVGTLEDDGVYLKTFSGEPLANGVRLKKVVTHSPIYPEFR